MFRDEIEQSAHTAIQSEKEIDPTPPEFVASDDVMQEDAQVYKKESKQFELTDLFGIQLLGPMGWTLPNFGGEGGHSNKENNESNTSSMGKLAGSSTKAETSNKISNMMVDDEQFVEGIVKSSHLLSDVNMPNIVSASKKKFGEGTLAGLQVESIGEQPQESSPSSSMPRRGWHTRRRQLAPRRGGPPVEESSPSRGHVPFSLTPEKMNIW